METHSLFALTPHTVSVSSIRSLACLPTIFTTGFLDFSFHLCVGRRWVIRGFKSCTGDRAAAFNNVWQCVSVPDGRLNILSVFVQLMAEVSSVKSSQNNEKRVWVFLLHTGYLVTQALQRLSHTGLRRDASTRQNKRGTLPQWIKWLNVNERSLKVRPAPWHQNAELHWDKTRFCLYQFRRYTGSNMWSTT